MGRVEPLDGITSHTIHTPLLERRRELPCECDEHVDAAVEQHPVDLSVRIPTVDWSGRYTHGVQQPGGRQRRDFAPPPEPSVRQQ